VKKTNSTRSLLALLSVAFVDNFAFSLVLILFAPLVLDPSFGLFSVDYSVSTRNMLLGVLLGSFPFLLFFAAPFWGDHADQIGRKKTLVLTLFGTIVGHTITALGIMTKNYPLLLFARAFTGFFAGNMSVCLAGISDLSPDPKLRSKNLGLWTVTQGLSAIASMTLGGAFIDTSSAATSAIPLWIAVVITALSYISVFTWLNETHPPKGRVKFKLSKSMRDITEAIRLPSLRCYLFIILFWTLGWGLPVQCYAPIGLEHFHSDPKTISYYMAVLCLCWAIGGGILNRILIKKFSSTALSLFSMLLAGLILLFLPLAGNLPDFSLFYWSIALIAPLAVTNNINLVSTSAPKACKVERWVSLNRFSHWAG
jgi:MFS family permease